MQIKFLKKLGCIVEIVDSKEDVKDFLRRLGGGNSERDI